MENTNKAIAKNTLFLYLKLGVTSVCGLLTTRYALLALGVTDYGLFSVLGSIISFVAILNTIMVSTTNRYIAVSLGKGDIEQANTLFNVCLVIHFVIAIITALIAYPLGYWYVHNALNYAGDISNAMIVYNLTVTASIFSFFAVPYSGLLQAKENFWIFCLPPIFGSVVRLITAILITYFFTNKLIIFAAVTALYGIYPPLHYMRYCYKHYRSIVSYKFVKERKLYKEITSFSGWVAYGAVAYVGKAQGAAILINLFFTTVMNTALGVANSVNGIVGQISRSASQSIDPQITKSFAAGDRQRSDELLVLSTKITFLIMFIISTPFLVDCEWILSLWLGQVPEYAVTFTLLLIIDNLIDSMNSGVKSIIFASGKIVLFQVIPSTLKLCSIVVAYFVLKSGTPAYSLIIVYIFFSIMVVIINQLILKKCIDFNSTILFKKSYLPSIIIVILSMPVLLFNMVSPVVRIAIAIIYIACLILFIGLSKDERIKLYSFVSNKLTKNSIKSNE